MWLWEMHNDIKVRLMKEEAERTGLEVTLLEEDSVRWPSKESSADCLHDDKTWDEGAVYAFLCQEYWPDASLNFAEDTKASDDPSLASKNTVVRQSSVKSTREINSR